MKHFIVNQCTPSFNAYNIEGRILSLSAAFLNCSPRMAAATSVDVKTYILFVKFNRIACISEYCPYTVQKKKKSSTYSLRSEKISFLPLKMFPSKFLINIGAIDLFSTQAVNG